MEFRQVATIELESGDTIPVVEVRGGLVTLFVTRQDMVRRFPRPNRKPSANQRDLTDQLIEMANEEVAWLLRLTMEMRGGETALRHAVAELNLDRYQIAVRYGDPMINWRAIAAPPEVSRFIMPETEKAGDLVALPRNGKPRRVA